MEQNRNVAATNTVHVNMNFVEKQFSELKLLTV